MKIIPTDLTAELVKDITAMQHLILMETPTMIYRWTDGASAVYWDGFWYMPKAIDYTNLNSSITGQLDSLDLEIDNVDKSFSDMILAESIRGSEFTIYRACLYNNNAVIGGATIIFSGFVNSQSVDRQRGKIQIFNYMIRHRLMTPRRQHTPSCPWVFKDTNCGYVGEVYRNPISDILAGFTKSHWSYNYQCVDDRLTDLCAGGTATSDSDEGIDVAASAFDGNAATHWSSSNTTAPHWICYQHAVARIINKYKIFPNSSVYGPKDFSFQGSNGGGVWIDLDKHVGVTWSTETFKAFDFTCSTSYLYHRLYISKNQGGIGGSNYSIINSLEMYGPPSQYNDSDYNSTSGTGIVKDVFSISPIVFSNDVTGISVALRVRSKQTTGAARNLAGVLRINGTDYVATAISPGTSLTDYDFSWLLNPVRSAAWKYGDFQGIDLCVGGTPLADSEYNSNYIASYAFDNVAANYWLSTNTALPHWIQYRLPAAKTVYAYSIRVQGTYPNYDPKDFKLQGSNNGSSWSDLNSQTGITWTGAERKYFGVASPASYEYYRIYVTANASGNYTGIEEVELFEYDYAYGIGYQTPADAGGHQVEASECFLKVSNDITSMTCDLTSDRCEALNNRDQFGGFAHIFEMQTKEFWWGNKQKVWGGGL
jgi:phage-related protein